MHDLQRLIDAQDRLKREVDVLDQMLNKTITTTEADQHLAILLAQAKRVTRSSRLVSQALAILRDAKSQTTEVTDT